MYIPEFISKAKSGDILATKYNHLLMVERVEIVERHVSIYFYFNWDEELGLQMNEWLRGFYGPGYSEDFYRQATKEEESFFLSEMKKFGYELRDIYGRMEPGLTLEGYKKYYE